MEKILNLQRGWKSRLWFGEKAFALCFVIFTAFTGLVSVNAGPGALYESHTFRTILIVMLTAAAYVIAIDLVYNMMFNFSQRFYQSIVVNYLSHAVQKFLWKWLLTVVTITHL